MAVTNGATFEAIKNCKVSDLVDGEPPSTDYDEGTNMQVWDDTTKQLVSIFMLINGEWMKL